MSKVHVLDVKVCPNVGNPAPFMSQIEFEITFECIEALSEDLVWKIVYVGSAESEKHDQILDTIYVGPIPEGRHKFLFAADPPDARKIPVSDVVGVTVILLSCAYREQEFIKIGYYVNNEYTDPTMQETPPEQPQFDKLQRIILAEKPRVNKLKINWDQNGASSLGEELASSSTIEASQGTSDFERKEEETMDINSNDSSISTANMPRFPRLDYDADDSMSNSSNSNLEAPKDTTKTDVSDLINPPSSPSKTEKAKEPRSLIDKALDESLKAFNSRFDNPSHQTKNFMDIRES